MPDTTYASVPRVYTVPELVSCVAREIAMRRNVYPKYIERGKMKPEAADKEIATMTQVCTALVNGAALHAAATEIVRLKEIKKKIEEGVATIPEREEYRSRKAQAWTNLAAALKP